MHIRGTCLAQSIERVTLYLGVVNSSPMWGIEERKEEKEKQKDRNCLKKENCISSSQMQVGKVILSCMAFSIAEYLIPEKKT